MFLDEYPAVMLQSVVHIHCREGKQPHTSIMEGESDRVSCLPVASAELRLEICGYVEPHLWAGTIASWCLLSFEYRSSCFDVRGGDLVSLHDWILIDD